MSGYTLPGASWESGNMFEYHQMPNFNMEDAVFNDVNAWGFGNPGSLHVRELPNKVFTEIFYSDVARRLLAIEQLTTPPQYSTIPNTGAFARAEHVWGSVLFTQQMCIKHKIDDETAAKYMARTLTSDLAHTTGSHLGDWIFQGIGGAEDQHDQELMEYLEATGVATMLRRNNIEPAEVVFPEVNDWVVASQPDLCVDRVDY
jgi:hypothetical protein